MYSSASAYAMYPGPYLAGGAGGSPPPVIVEKGALFASRCPFSDAKSPSSAGWCPSEPRTAPSPAILGCMRTAMVSGIGVGLFQPSTITEGLVS